MKTKTVNIITWILQGFMSVAFLMAGGTKVATPYEQLKETLPWVVDYSANTVMLIGSLEILGVIGMNLPLIIRKLKFFSPIAALGLAGTMVGAIQVHINRNESFAMQLVFLVILLFIALVRYNRLKTV